MRIDALIWTDENIEHILRHRIEPSEVDEVCFGETSLVVRVGSGRPGKGRYAVYGQTEASRYIAAYLDRTERNQFYPVTARDMTNRERTRYRSLV